MAMQPSRRDFLSSIAAASVCAAVGAGQTESGDKPNILWIVSEDNNPYLGCYGETLVRTPTLDGLAKSGVLYENCFSTAPVCAPSRFTLISGMYATCCAPANHMRAQGKPPKGMRGLPAYLRDAGYYCSNNAKTDYNAPINLAETWDESSRKAHWRNRPAGKPFFSVFNFEVTHESQLFPENQAKYEPLASPTDPARVTLPAYHPDTPEFRSDRAHYFDQMARLDAQVKALLAQLEEDGLADKTIVFYYGDNGGVLPRSKRFVYDSGTHVPLMVRVPDRFRRLAPAPPGSRIAAPVSFVDFAPTVLSIAGLRAPKHMQGQAFAGEFKSGAREYAFSFRNRMDERYDMVRSVRDRRYRYIRNYMPHLIWGQHVEYMFQMPSVQAWARLHAQGKLRGPQNRFWEEKPEEELYDLQKDPSEVINLAADPAHRAALEKLRAACEQQMKDIRDNGFIPEGSELEGFDNTRDPATYPIERIMEVANTVTKRDPAKLSAIVQWLDDPHECVRYWAALGCLMLGEKAAPVSAALERRLKDGSSPVRVAAAEALSKIGRAELGLPVLTRILLEDTNAPARLQAANALERLNLAAALPFLEKAANDGDDYVRRCVRYAAGVVRNSSAVGR
jgi:arylsulfatase A-like enzyme